MKQNFKIEYSPQLNQDIQQVIDYYYRETGNYQLGKRFVKNVKSSLQKLKTDALHYRIRYDDIRFIPITSFSFMAHYRVNEAENSIFVEAIFHTSQSPDSWKNKAE